MGGPPGGGYGSPAGYGPGSPGQGSFHSPIGSFLDTFVASLLLDTFVSVLHG